MDGHVVQLADLDRAGVHHARSGRRQLEHLVVANMAQLPRCLDDARISAVDAVDVGVDLAGAGSECASERNRCRIRSTPTQRGHLELLGHALETCDDSDLALFKRLQDAIRPNVMNARTRVMRARANTGLQPRKRHGGHTHALQAHRNQRSGDRFSVGDEHVELARRRLGVDAFGKRDQPVSGVTHRRYDSDHLLPIGDGGSDPAAYTPDAGGRADRSTSVLLDDHRERNMPFSVILATSARPCVGAAAAMIREMRVACEAAQNANTLGPEPQIEAA